MYLKFNEISSFSFIVVYISSLIPGNITWKHDSGGLKQKHIMEMYQYYVNNTDFYILCEKIL